MLNWIGQSVSCLWRD